MSPSFQRPRPFVGGLYAHYKGGRYIVIGFTRRETDLELLVSYVREEDLQDYLTGEDVIPWSRPVAEWTQQVVGPDGLGSTRYTSLED